MVVCCFVTVRGVPKAFSNKESPVLSHKIPSKKVKKKGLSKGVFPVGHEDYMSLPIVSEATTYPNDLSKVCKCISRLHPIFVECFCESQRPSRSTIKQRMCSSCNKLVQVDGRTLDLFTSFARNF